MAVGYNAGGAAVLIFSEYEFLDSDDERSDIEEDFTRLLPVDIGDGKDEDGTT